MIPEWLPPVARYMATGAKTTLLLSLVGVVLSIIIGLGLGALRTVPARAVRLAAKLYMELWRGLPLIVTLFFVYFALPYVGIRLNTFVSAAIGLVLWGSANASEVVRGAIESVPRAQSEAAAALGFGWIDRMRYVVVPQAVPRMLPPLVSLVAYIAQSTSVTVLIGVLDVLGTAERSIQRLTFSAGDPHAVAILSGVLLFFFVISFPLTMFARRLERRVGATGDEMMVGLA